MYCIINRSKELNETYYLAWQNPAWDEDGYFWTSKETAREILFNNTKEHPFLFNSRREAIEFLKSSNIYQKCSIIKWVA